ncbi:MAG TPA: FtsQ-type POTRA domain-containing protein [Gemmatimonadaceae bacterium]|nr:FtsQ-type POTRA domain-containing protein [Gemmatimonadaceae bacterium]
MTRLLNLVSALTSRAGLWGAAAVLALAVVVSAPRWGPRILSHMSYFQIRHVEVSGQRYLPPREVLSLLGVDTTISIWTDLDSLENRLAAHPEIRAARIERKLPGTLQVRVTENLPVAFIPVARGLGVVDEDGATLPIDPSRVDVDLPVVQRADTALLSLLADLRDESPRIFERISAARRDSRGDVELTLPSYSVLAGTGVSAARLAEIVPVENDLARRGARIAQLDLRFRDQVIARLQ